MLKQDVLQLDPELEVHEADTETGDPFVRGQVKRAYGFDDAHGSRRLPGAPGSPQSKYSVGGATRLFWTATARYASAAPASSDTASAWMVAAMRTASSTTSEERPASSTAFSWARTHDSQSLMALTASANSSKSC